MTDLEENRDYLLRSLEDLDRERASGDLEEQDYLALRDEYTARAGAVLRAIDDPTGVGTPVRASGGRPSRWRSVLVTASLLAFAGGAGALVARSAGQRLPGGAATGAIVATGPSAGVADDLARARGLIGEGKTLDAIKVYDGVLERDPRQPEALAYRGWLLRLAGRASGRTDLIDKGMEYLDRAVAADPTYPDARFFRGFVLYQDRHDPGAAVPELRAFLSNDPAPEMVPVVEDLLRRALADLEASAGGPRPAERATTGSSAAVPPG